MRVSYQHPVVRIPFVVVCFKSCFLTFPDKDSKRVLCNILKYKITDLCRHLVGEHSLLWRGRLWESGIARTVARWRPEVPIPWSKSYGTSCTWIVDYQLSSLLSTFLPIFNVWWPAACLSNVFQKLITWLLVTAQLSYPGCFLSLACVDIYVVI